MICEDELMSDAPWHYGHLFMNCAEDQGASSLMLTGESYITFVLWRMFDVKKKYVESNWICRTVNRIQTLLHSKILFIILNPPNHNSKHSFLCPAVLYCWHSVPVFIYLLQELNFENVKIKKLCVARSVLVDLERYNSSSQYIHGYFWLVTL